MLGTCYSNIRVVANDELAHNELRNCQSPDEQSNKCRIHAHIVGVEIKANEGVEALSLLSI